MSGARARPDKAKVAKRKGPGKSRPNLAIQMSHRGRFVKVFPTSRRVGGPLHAMFHPQDAAGPAQALLPSGGALASASSAGAMRLSSSFLYEFTRVDTGHIVIGSAG